MSLLRMIALTGWCSFIGPLQYTALALRLKAADHIPRIFHHGVLWIFGLSVEAEGAMRQERPTLFVSNHVSYLDIFVLGSLIDGSFVAKADVAGWPVAGFFARLQRTIFIQRERRSSAGAQRDMLQSRLEEGVNVILFPEGTSFDGARVLPFKSALFSAAERKVDGTPVTVQPMSLAYVTMGGLPLTRAQRPAVAWYGDMGLLPHVWQFLKANRTRAVVKFHDPISIEALGNRRLMARACHTTVADGVTGLISGRPGTLPIPVPAKSAGA